MNWRRFKEATRKQEQQWMPKRWGQRPSRRRWGLGPGHRPQLPSAWCRRPSAPPSLPRRASSSSPPFLFLTIACWTNRARGRWRVSKKWESLYCKGREKQRGQGNLMVLILGGMITIYSLQKRRERDWQREGLTGWILVVLPDSWLYANVRVPTFCCLS